MPRPIPTGDGNSHDQEYESFNRGSAHKALEGCHCEEAELLRAMAVGGSRVQHNNEVVDLASIARLAYIAMCEKHQRSCVSISFGFPQGKLFRLYFSKGNRDTVPKARVVREIIQYFFVNANPTEFTRHRPDEELVDGTLQFGEASFKYMLVPDPFHNG